MVRFIYLAFLAAVVFISCDNQSQTAAERGITEFSHDAIKAELFSKDGEIQNGQVKWQDSLMELSDFNIAAEEPLVSQIIGSEVFNLEEKSVGVALFETVESICDFCIPVIGVAYFEKEDEVWELDNIEYVERIGYEDGIQNIEPVKIGPSSVGFIAKSSQQEHQVQNEGLWVFANWDGSMQNVMEILSAGENNTGICEDDETIPCYEFSMDVRIDEEKGEPLYDLFLEQIGTKLENDEVEEVDETFEVSFADGEYQLPDVLKEYRF